MEAVNTETSSSSKDFSCQIRDKIEERPERPSSPMDCAICLDPLTDKSFTNSCLHMFCFHCLVSWSKIKPECPLCKQDFCSIIHNIRSMNDYDEYHVPPPDTRLSVIVNPDITPNPLYARADNFFANQRSFLSYRTTITSGAYRLPRRRPDNLLIQPYVDNLEIQASFPRLNHNPPSLSGINRRLIYVNELETLPPPSDGRFRQCSPEFYRQNESQIHRLVRWLQRELTALELLASQLYSVTDFLRLIVDMLPRFHINSSTFCNTVNRFLGPHTSRFISELYRFATSPFEMEQYDRESVFIRQGAGSSLSFIVTVGRDDSEEIQILPNVANHSFRPWIDINDLGRAHSTASSTDINSVPLSSQYSRPFSSGFLGHPMSNDQASTSSATTVINISDSENDDCVIIDQVRSAHETIILDDSDDEETKTKVTEPLVSTLSDSRKPASSRHTIGCSPSTSSQTVDSIDLTANASSSIEYVTSIKDECDNEGPAQNISLVSPALDISSRGSSVLSTDASSDEEAANNSSLSKKCGKKRVGRRYRGRDLKKKKTSRGSQIYKSSNVSIFSTESSDIQTDEDDLDWVKSYRRGKRTKKASTSRRTTKKKKHVLREKSDGTENVGRKIGIQNISSEVSRSFVIGGAEIQETFEPVSQHRLRSIVRRVENPSNGGSRTRKTSSTSSVCSCPDLSQFKNEPCTSDGIYNRHLRTCKFFPIVPFSRNTYYSDSD